MARVARLAVVVLSVFAALLAGMPAGRAAPAVFCDATPAIQPGLALGPVALGMPAADVHRLLMVPGTNPIPSSGPGGFAQVAYMGGPNTGIIQTARDGVVVMLALIEDGGHTQAACRTPQGIHLGSSMNDVAAAYGWPRRTFRAASGRLFWIYDARGVGFAGGTGLIDEVTAIEVFRSGQYCQTATVACH